MFGQRRIILLPVGLLALLGGLTIYMAIGHSLASRESQRLVAHTYQVLDTNQRALLALQDAETAARAYILSGDESFVRAFGGAGETVRARLAELQALVSASRAPRRTRRRRSQARSP